MGPSCTFLFVPLEAVGHINAVIGIGQQLLQRGHRVVFATPNTWKGKLQKFGFEEEYYQNETEESNDNFSEVISALAPYLPLSSIQKMETLTYGILQECISKAKKSDPGLRELMLRVQPDVVVVDFIQMPAVTRQDVPWILLSSPAPLGIWISEELPPALSGYSAFDTDKTRWREYSEREHQIYQNLFQEFKEWVLENGGPALQFQGFPLWHTHSPYANIYMYPEEMSYSMHSPEPPNWRRFDALVRHEEGNFEIPVKLLDLPGKLVYFSLGSIGCLELGLMHRLLEILAKSPHRFIVSKGPLGDLLILADNMWGANSLPQTLILPLVDLVITHGGNNTITESFYFGKPLLVLPLFGDQLDNGTRVEDTGHGLQFEPYRVTKEQLLAGIEKLLGNELLTKRMKATGARIRAENCQAKAADLVESVAFKHKIKYITTE